MCWVFIEGPGFCGLKLPVSVITSLISLLTLHLSPSLQFFLPPPPTPSHSHTHTAYQLPNSILKQSLKLCTYTIQPPATTQKNTAVFNTG